MPVSQEHSRLAELRRLDILYSEPLGSFDRIARMTKRLFGCSAAIISFVGDDTVWFKAAEGGTRDSVPRNRSFSDETIRADRLLVVPDALRDRRFAGNPWVCGGRQLRFFAGAPILAPRGDKIGAVCVLDGNPRPFTGEDRDCLLWLAAMARTELALLEIVRPRSAIRH
jgi:GAF domain-containing protein